MNVYIIMFLILNVTFVIVSLVALIHNIIKEFKVISYLGWVLCLIVNAIAVALNIIKIVGVQ